MTELYTDEERSQRLIGADAIQQELKQFRRLQHLSDHDVAFRMASTLNEVRKLRKQFHQLDHRLSSTGIDYAIRVILGERGVSTTGQLFAMSDRDLLAIPQIGRARLEHIREMLKEHFG